MVDLSDGFIEVNLFFLPWIKMNNRTFQILNNNFDNFVDLKCFKDKEIIDILDYDEFMKFETFIITDKKKTNVNLVNEINYDLFKIKESEEIDYIIFKKTEFNCKFFLKILKRIFFEEDETYYFVIDSDTKKIIFSSKVDKNFYEKFKRYGDNLFDSFINYLKIINYNSIDIKILENNNIKKYCLRDPLKINDEEFRIIKNIININNKNYICIILRRITEISNKIKELEDLAKKDPLTGVLNRNGFYERFDHEIKVHKKYSKDLTLLILDLDKFKNVNDRFGHDFGDLVLQYFTDVLKNKLRDSDVLARFGGEEFVILLPLTNREVGVKIAERLRKEVEEKMHNFMNKISITTSIGVTSHSFRKGDVTFKDLYKRCDKALYLAKNNGRNQVFVL